MKIVIGNTTYTELKNLSFAPSADLINDRLSIDEVICDIVTSGQIAVGSAASLKDESNNLWFSGYVMYAEEEVEHVIHVKIQSELVFLDRKTMPAVMYSAEPLSDAIDDVFEDTGASVSYDSAATTGVTLTGYCPEQNARERLQHILFATGLYCKASFVSHPVISQFDNNSVNRIPYEKIYWRPTINYEDYVTKVTVVQYSFSAGTPTDDDEYVEVGETKYIVSRTNVSLTNQTPAVTGDNEIIYDSVMLINNSNSSAVASLLATYYFDRRKVYLECINNGEYVLGKKYSAMVSDTSQCTGYCEAVDFTFGTQAKAKMSLGACTLVSVKKLTIEYVSQDNPPGEIVIAQRFFNFPAGMSYSIQAEYIDTMIDGFQYVFRPTTATITGTMGSTDTKVTVNCKVALRKDMKEGILEIISVDEVTRNEQGSGSDVYYEAEIE